MKTLRQQHGISMIEILITFAIIGILLGAAVPSFQSWLRSTQLRNQAETIQAGLNKARSEALRRNTRVTFWLVNSPDAKVLDNRCSTSDEGAAWVVSINDPTSKCGAAVSDSSDPRLIDRHAAADGSSNTTIAASPANAVAVTFNGLGQTTTNAAGSDNIDHIDVAHAMGQSGDRNYRITISAGGQVKLCDPQVSASNDPRMC